MNDRSSLNNPADGLDGVNEVHPLDFIKLFAVIFIALFPIVNLIGDAPIFLSAKTTSIPVGRWVSGRWAIESPAPTRRSNTGVGC